MGMFLNYVQGTVIFHFICLGKGSIELEEHRLLCAEYYIEGTM